MLPESLASLFSSITQIFLSWQILSAVDDDAFERHTRSILPDITELCMHPHGSLLIHAIASRIARILNLLDSSGTPEHSAHYRLIDEFAAAAMSLFGRDGGASVLWADVLRDAHASCIARRLLLLFDGRGAAIGHDPAASPLLSNLLPASPSSRYSLGEGGRDGGGQPL